MGRLGQGRGGLAQEQQTTVGFRTRRTKVHTGKGAIIGQFLIDGEQVKGGVSPALGETITAAEREASDLIHRDRIPRQYHKAVKAYFSNLQRSVRGETSGASHDDERPSNDASKSADPKTDNDSD